MAKFIDIDIQYTDSGYYDIYFEDGDFGKTKGFDTALKMSLLCEKRADSSEVPIPELQRGWWGNLIAGFDNFEIGSKLWLLQQARATQDTLNRAVNYTLEAFSWMEEDNFLDSINVSGEYRDNLRLILDIEFIRSQSVVNSFSFDLWNNTFLIE